jgi:hypothetical protein
MDDETKKELARLESKIDDIVENHLQDMWDALSTIWGYLQDLRKDFWKITGAGAAIISIVIAIVHCLG